jgi:hypothetical protein
MPRRSAGLVQIAQGGILQALQDTVEFYRFFVRARCSSVLGGFGAFSNARLQLSSLSREA